jgi:TrwC relaxase
MGACPGLGGRVVPAANSRDGDPQLHVHNLVLNKVATERDGRWRKLDSRSLYRFQGAAAAIAAAVTETALTREFGVALGAAGGQPRR